MNKLTHSHTFGVQCPRCLADQPECHVPAKARISRPQPAPRAKSVTPSCVTSNGGLNISARTRAKAAK